MVSMQEDTSPVVESVPTNRFHGANLPEDDEEGKEKVVQAPLNKVENYKWVPIV